MSRRTKQGRHCRLVCRCGVRLGKWATQPIGEAVALVWLGSGGDWPAFTPSALPRSMPRLDAPPGLRSTQVRMPCGRCGTRWEWPHDTLTTAVWDALRSRRATLDAGTV